MKLILAAMMALVASPAPAAMLLSPLDPSPPEARWTLVAKTTTDSDVLTLKVSAADPFERLSFKLSDPQGTRGPAWISAPEAEAIGTTWRPNGSIDRVNLYFVRPLRRAIITIAMPLSESRPGSCM